MTSHPQTIFAHSSGAAPAAIAVIRISGPSAHAAAEELAGRLPRPRQAALRTLRNPSGEVLDEALVLRFDAPASATGEDLVELHCHGSRAVVSAMMAVLGAMPGLREALPGEFTRRAFENGRIDLTQAEGLADLLEAETESQRRAALAVSDGAIRRQVEQWRERLVLLSARAEAAIDYADDEHETGAMTSELAASATSLAQELEAWLAKPRAEPLRRGLRIVLAGPPNAGKSSLLNLLAGIDKAITSPEAGTTRDVIEVPTALGGVPLLLIDTAGLRAGMGSVERTGIERAEREISAADLILWMGKPDDAPSRGRVINVHGRCDLPGRSEVASGSLGVSALTGAGIDELIAMIIAAAATLLPAADDTPLNQRQADALQSAVQALCLVSDQHLELTADALRQARLALDIVTGRAGVEDVLDQLFGRFCLGK